MEEKAFNLELGDIKKLTGNAFAYWNIITSTEKGTSNRTIVANFIVSPLLFNKHTIAATFPPVIFQSREKLFAIAEKAKIDIIKVDEISITGQEFDFSQFYKKQLNNFNNIVTKYSLLYNEGLSEVYQANNKPESDDVMKNLKMITELAKETRDAYLNKRNKTLAREMVIRMRKIANVLNSPNFKYDVENLIVVLSNPDKRVEKLTNLYFKKFLSIYTEHYEEAEKIKNKINTIKNNLEIDI